jgi:hypothetical protein
MSYDEDDAQRDAFYEEMRRQLAPEIIEAFNAETLRSYYVSHPDIMRPAIDAISEGNWQQDHGRHSAALVFRLTAIELFLKATLLRPVIYGLVRPATLAEIVVDHVLPAKQGGFGKYGDLLAQLFRSLAGIEIGDLRRAGQAKSLMSECEDLQRVRNAVVHIGYHATGDEAVRARLVALDVHSKIVGKMLSALRSGSARLNSFRLPISGSAAG